ncbi:MULTISPECIES: molybdopterin-dependent oxidoreductase [unclassified Nocardia]|uniref:molybdopterin-dependent oxidoreductase n=1 Tax=unclassified Nocardia TaxID=2637762 RepID=UPI00278C32A9|nr:MULTISPECIES: molybdopterin-dependent oxidoreductase [unclassified Nocardia]
MAERELRVASGIVAAGAILGAAELLAAIVAVQSAPLAAVGAGVVDHTPDAVREWAIDTFGTSDKLVLYLIMGAVAVTVAAGAGLLERVRRPLGSILFGAFGVLATVAALDRPQAVWTWALPTLVGVLTGIALLRTLIRRIEDLAARTNAPESHRTPGSGGTRAGAPGRPQEADFAGESHSSPPRRTAEPTGGDHNARAGDSDQARPIAEPHPGGRPEPSRGSDEGGTGSGRETVFPEPLGPPRASDPARAGGTAASGGSMSTGGGPVERDRGTAAASTVADSARMDRRAAVRAVAVAGVAAVATGAVGRWLGARARDVSGERAAVTLPPPSDPVTVLEGEADLRLPGLTPYVTSNADFYRIDTALILPKVSKDDWALRIHGMVDREIRLTYADLATRPAVERLVTLACVSNPIGGDLIGNASWLGYRLDELLAEAGPHPDADMVLSRSADGWTAGSPLSVLTDGRDALLAVGMNGEPLPVAHGYPARLVVPGLYGYVSATKWVTELEVTRFDRAQAYWTRRGWSARGPVKTGTRIDTPRSRSRLSPGRVVVAGVAWAQHRGIRAVEVRIDDGDWQPARLAAEPSVDTWRQWVFEWDATPGDHTVTARATDGTGAVQTAERRDVVPDGATGHPSVTVRIG